jgi:predicted aldo/keto reductase-like oxidoreductase
MQDKFRMLTIGNKASKSVKQFKYLETILTNQNSTGRNWEQIQCSVCLLTGPKRDEVTGEWRRIQ